MKKARRQRLSAGTLSGFCSEAALMLEAGLMLYEGMSTLAQSCKKSTDAALYRELAQRISERGTLYEALKGDDRFPKYLTEMVGIGEATGGLEGVMQGLAEYYEREERIRAAIAHACTYPLVLGAMFSVIVFIVLWQVMPVFRRVLVGMGVGMEGAAGGMMRAGAAIGWVVLALMLLALLFAAVCLVLMRTDKRARVTAFLARIFPKLRRIEEQMSASRLAQVLSMAVSNGFSMEDALRMATLVMGNPRIAAKVAALHERVRGGAPFADALDEAHIFDVRHSRMIRLSVAAGYEERVLKKMAKLYEEDAMDGVESLISVIEPTLVAVLSVVIGAILLSVMLPMLGILRSMV